ncbi:MAG: hypothetical protein F6K31_23810 [Symploca sp. SIO2G7]|nr:hypothetical protein [Symploca sp. SIO2G7]
MSTTPLKLNLADGSVTFSFTASAARDLQHAIAQFMQRLKAATQASGSGRASTQKPMEYQFSGEVFFEVFCNPNIYASPFAAKVLITLRDERIRLSTEAELTRLIDDLNEYLEQAG